jgi:hypothetical protein
MFGRFNAPKPKGLYDSARGFNPGNRPEPHRALEWRSAIQKSQQQRLAKASCETSQRDGAIVAWHEVPGTASRHHDRAVPSGTI